MLLIDKQAAVIVAFIGAVELLLKFMLRHNRQQSFRVHAIDIRADIFNV